MATPGFSFPGPEPKEALEYFRRKGLRVGFDHRDVWREEHAAAFTVAKAMHLDVLTQIRAEVDRALAEGRTLAQFKKDLKPRLVELGWWGRKEMTDPVTGEIREVQLGSPRRLRAIYRTNLRTALAAGQWERIERTKAGLPYLLYQLGPSREHRPEHVAWHGLLLPVDDPFWASHMPPNGWGCKCRVRQVTRNEAERIKQDGVQIPGAQELDPDTGLPTGRLVKRRMPVRTEAPRITRREWVNKRTGEVTRVPIGIDPGWDYNPGVAGRFGQALEQMTGKLESAHADDAHAALRELARSPVMAEFLARPRGAFPVMRLSDGAAAAIGAERRVAVLSAESAAKNVEHHPDLSPADYALLPELGAAPTLIVQDATQKIVIVKRGEDLWYAAVKATSSGQGTFLLSFRRTNARDVRALLRKGKVIFGRWDEE